MWLVKLHSKKQGSKVEVAVCGRRAGKAPSVVQCLPTFVRPRMYDAAIQIELGPCFVANASYP